jgi:hypothetical protein
MSIDELLDLLAACKDRFQWRLLQPRRSYFVGSGLLRGQVNGEEFCPLSAAYLYKTGVKPISSVGLGAGVQIGLSLEDCSRVIDAADGVFNQDKADVRNLRQRLLDVLGFGLGEPIETLWGKV